MQKALDHRALLDAVSERRDLLQPDERIIGHVIACTGSQATISTASTSGRGIPPDYWAIGRLISIQLDDSRIVGMVFRMRALSEQWDVTAMNGVLIEVELVGQIRDLAGGRTDFSRGIANYPSLGATAHRIRQRDLQAVFEQEGGNVVEIGRLSQDPAIAASINVDFLLNRHFAIVGTTGTGKSSAVSLLVHQALSVKPNLRVLVLDPHNEFSHAFQDCSVTLDAASLELPFWMFRFDEFEEVVFRGRPPVPEESDILREMIVVARARYRTEAPSMAAGGSLLLRRPGGDGGSATADTPSPYRMADLVKVIDETLGQLEPRYARHHLTGLKSKLESLVFDPRFRFMFGHMSDTDSMPRIVGRIFRVPHEGKRVSVFQLGGIPSEVVNSVASVLSRMAFDLAMWGGGRYEILVICEEAHRYVPLDQKLGFLPTRQAIARIAKEGRKYGAYLGIVTQRPGELDPTILSQCSTVFAMRLANDRDQDIIRSAIADSSASTIEFLSAIGNREAIAFGEAVPTPMRMRFSDQPSAHLPASLARQEKAGPMGEIDITSLVAKMRGSTRF